MNNYKRNSEAWLQKVQKELNGKAMGELEFNLDSLHKVDPIRSYLYDPKDKAQVALLPASSYLSYLRIYSKAECNLVLDALDGGANGIYFECQESFDLRDLEMLLEGVFGQMIVQVFDIEKCKFPKDALQEKLRSMGLESNKYFLIDKKHSYKVNISQGEVITPIEILIKKILQDESLIHQPIILKPTQHFFVNIAAIRALRVLLMNLECAIEPKILVVKEASTPNGDFNQSLIEFTSDALSSRIGGADYICLKPQLNDSNQLNTLRNIPNLFSLESELESHYDGVEGARNLDFLVDKICKEVWAKLKEE